MILRRTEGNVRRVGPGLRARQARPRAMVCAFQAADILACTSGLVSRGPRLRFGLVSRGPRLRFGLVSRGPRLHSGFYARTEIPCSRRSAHIFLSSIFLSLLLDSSSRLRYREGIKVKNGIF